MSAYSTEHWDNIYAANFCTLTEAEATGIEREAIEVFPKLDGSEIRQQLVKAIRALAKKKMDGEIRFHPKAPEIIQQIRFHRKQAFLEDVARGNDQCACRDGWMYIYPEDGEYENQVVAVPCRCWKGERHRQANVGGRRAYTDERLNNVDIMFNMANRAGRNISALYSGEGGVQALQQLLDLDDATNTNPNPGMTADQVREHYANLNIEEHCKVVAQRMRVSHAKKT